MHPDRLCCAQSGLSYWMLNYTLYKSDSERDKRSKVKGQKNATEQLLFQKVYMMHMIVLSAV
jgi:hypothetical protein